MVGCSIGCMRYRYTGSVVPLIELTAIKVIGFINFTSLKINENNSRYQCKVMAK